MNLRKPKGLIRANALCAVLASACTTSTTTSDNINIYEQQVEIIGAAEKAPVRAEVSLLAAQGESVGAKKIIGVLLHLRDSVVDTLYQGRTVIRKEDGYYAWDCSGMGAWILKRGAPRALKSMKKDRPVARDFFKMIQKAPVGRSRRGWEQLAHVSDARPGDLFAWLRSPASKSKISGHVGFLVSTPVPMPDHPKIYSARIVDATSLPHGDDTRPRKSGGGFGFGTLLFMTDDKGKTVAYGWHGARSLDWGFMPAEVLYGRVTR